MSYREDEVELSRNFMSFGFLPELVGRFKRIVPFTALGREELALILRTHLLPQFVMEFTLEGKDLVVEDGVLDLIVEEGLKKETGARALEAAFTRCVEEAAFEAYSDPAGKTVTLLVRDGRIVHDIGR